MKALMWSTMILGAVAMTACDRHCEYGSAKQVTAKVSVVPVDPNPVTSNCINDPVEIRLSWGNDFYPITTTDGRNLPRECAESLGFVDGADWNVTISENTGTSGIPIGLVVCEPFIILRSDLHIGECDAVCDEEPRCPMTEPVDKVYCSGSLSCHYGDPVTCPPEPGTSKYYDCVDNKWTVTEKANCDVCGVSCGPPPCLYCGEVLAESIVPPAQITFCNDISVMLYDAFWNCTCVSGGACESVCNTGSPSYCNGGVPSMECVNCLFNTASPSGCADVTNACSADL